MITAPDGYKFVRFYGLQYAVKQTAKNKERVAAGLKAVGRPRPRLVSFDYAGIYIVPQNWTLQDAASFAPNCAKERKQIYVVVYMDNEYYPLVPNAIDIAQDFLQSLIDAGDVVIMPEESLYRW